MTLIRKLASAACLVLSFTASLSNAQTTSVLDATQVYNTGELVTFNPTGSGSTSPWQNVGQWGGSLTCWSPGGPGYCGPQPYVNANGYGAINFSYGYTDLYQVVNIAAALPNSGTGLRVNGFNFGFMAKNGNGWDNGQQDYLAAYVNFYGSDGKLVQNYNYGNYTNQTYNWTNFYFSETFSQPYATKDLSTARYGFVGYDTNFWAGPYGPEVTNVTFNLKYSVDPCSVDVLSSPSCPGYLDKINSLSAPAATTATTPTTTTSSQPSVTISPTGTITDIAQPTATASAPLSSSTAVSAPVVGTSPVTTSVTPTATNPQPKVGEVTVSGSPAKTTMSTSQILSIVRNEQTRIGNLETSTAQQAVEQAQAAGDKAQKDSLSISAATISQIQASGQAAIATITAAQAQSTSAAAASGNNNNSSNSSGLPTAVRNTGAEPMKMPEFENTAGQPTATKPVSIYNLTTFVYVPPISTAATASAPSSYTPPKFETRSESEDQPKQEGIKFTGVNPVLNIINNTAPTPNQTADTQPASTAVNTKVQDNDAANGGVSITAMARQPQGFESYMSMLPDSAFYAPKEIYRNQRVVDNARAQRLLSGASDRLHQEMIDSQYNKK